MSSIPLSRLVDFSIQRTYQELLVLADLLPRKSDIERKIEISQFANRTRQLFIRLLALVKWAGNASKVEKCSTIVGFLDKQAMLFVETADVLSKMSRETLVQARLPAFQLPCAVEVLTLGTYLRLPTCIRDRIVPPDPITPSERRTTLQRLNQIILQRLVSSGLSPRMKKFKIEQGRVVFHVDHEFEITLTLMGDGPNIPWRVLNVDILVEDKETGEGKDLVHPRQITFLQHLVQTRLTESSKNLADPYNVLHTFCLSLQLEVLNVQAIRLSRERLGDYIRVEEYVPGEKLYISYWRDPAVLTSSNTQSLVTAGDGKPSIGCRLCIEINTQDSHKPLHISHQPELGSKETAFANKAIKSDHLSVEKLLIHTIHERTKQNLRNIQKQLREIGVFNSDLTGSPATLAISLIQPCISMERLLLSIDSLTGTISAHIPQFEDCPLVDDIEATLRKDVSKVAPLLQRLKIWIIRERYKRTAQLLPVTVHERISLTGVSDHAAFKGNQMRIFFQFCKHQKNYLMLVFDTESTGEQVNGSIKKMKNICDVRYYLLTVDNSAMEPNTGGNEKSSDKSCDQQQEMDQPKIFLKIVSILTLDMSCIISYRHHSASGEGDTIGMKRKLVAEEPEGNKRSRSFAFYKTELSYLVSFCEEKLIYGALSKELQTRKICHQIRLSDEPNYEHFVDIVQFPPAELGRCRLSKNLISCSIRFKLEAKNGKVWFVALTFYNDSKIQNVLKDSGTRRCVYFMYGFLNGNETQITQLVNELLDDWMSISKLYDVFADYADVCEQHSNYGGMCEVKSYTYKKLVVGYGQNKNYIVSIQWNSTEKRYQLSFGVGGIAFSLTNPHNLVSFELQHEFNQHHSIANLIQTLTVTLNPLLTIQNIASYPLLGVINSRPQVPVQSFAIIPQSSSHIRLVYRNTYCIDVVIHADGLIAIRDGAFSLFDKGAVLEDLSPIQGLKAFLSRFVDKNAAQMRRLSQTEDDNPPSPVAAAHMDTSDGYGGYQAGQIGASPAMNDTHISQGGMRNMRIGQGQNQGQLGSHPNTPSSPHTSVLGQQAYAPSPSAFPLASPPSHGGYQGAQGPGGQQGGPPGNQIVPSPSVPNVNHAEPSPGNMFGVNSPINPSPSFLPISSPSASINNIHSPASNFMNQPQQTGPGPQSHPQQDHSVASPFQGQVAPGSNISMPSPVSAVSAWPTSPSIARPSPSRQIGSAQSPVSTGLGHSPQTSVSPHYHNVQGGGGSGHMQTSMRFLPQRSWAAAIPTLLTHAGFDSMCMPNAPLDMPQAPYYNIIYASFSQLERFLGCVFLRKNFQRILSSDDSQHQKIQVFNNVAPNIIQFKTELMQFVINLHSVTMQSLHLKISQEPHSLKNFPSEDLDILERYFESKVVCAPYKPNAFISFSRFLTLPDKVLKSAIQLMRLELFPDRGLRWTMQLMLTIAPMPAQFGNPGMSALIYFKSTIMCFIQFTRVTAGLPPNSEPQSIIVPLLYDVSRNQMSVADLRQHSALANNPVFSMINTILNNYNELVLPTTDCILFTAIRDIMMIE